MLSVCHETTTRGGTLLESVVLGVEPCNVLQFLRDLVGPVCDVLVVLSRLLLVECLCPKTGTSMQDTMNSNEEL